MVNKWNFRNGVLVKYFFIGICDALCDLVLFVQFEKTEKHPSSSVLLHGCFSRFLDLEMRQSIKRMDQVKFVEDIL